MNSSHEKQLFLPMSRLEMDRLGWDELDVLLVTGDGYVDHPSFGAALLGRWLVENGYRVGIVAQPRWDTVDDVAGMGRPRLFAGVTAGALDSMLAHYTAFRKKRSDDAYTPGGLAGARPNRATIVYSGLVRQAFPGLTVAIGGIEASLRRVSHYDFWTGKLRRSLLLDSKADVLVYGMAEWAVVEIARRCAAGEPLAGVPGTASAASNAVGVPADAEVVELPSHEAIESDPKLLMKATLAMERIVLQGRAWAVQTSGKRQVILAPPAAPLTTGELDRLYALPFTRRAHPSYREAIPAVEMIAFSVTAHRGCGGGCTFCSLALHQGRRIASRSRKSILEEVGRMTEHPGWRGSVTDVGGPSANMWGAQCVGNPESCRRASCLHPSICPQLKADQRAMVRLLRDVARLPKVSHVRVSSGIRHDLAIKDLESAGAVIREFTGGQLKLAPEHICDHVLRLMRKPGFEVFERFLTIFEAESAKTGKNLYVVPYLLSAFPGSTERDMRELAGWLRKQGWRPQQVQCFIPTPGTVATAMYYGEIDPEGRPVYVAKTDAERLRQHRILVG